MHTVVLYAISAVYFAGVMVRLIQILAPIVCVLAAIAISHSLDNYIKPVFSLNKEGNVRYSDPPLHFYLPPWLCNNVYLQICQGVSGLYVGMAWTCNICKLYNLTTNTLKAYLSAQASPFKAFVISKIHILPKRLTEDS